LAEDLVAKEILGQEKIRFFLEKSTFSCQGWHLVGGWGEQLL